MKVRFLHSPCDYLGVKNMGKNMEKEKEEVKALIRHLLQQTQSKRTDIIEETKITEEDIEATMERMERDLWLCGVNNPHERASKIIYETKRNEFARAHGIDKYRPLKGWDRCMFMKVPKYDELNIDLLDEGDNIVKHFDIPLSEANIVMSNNNIQYIEDSKTLAIFRPASFARSFYKHSKEKTVIEIIEDLKSRVYSG